MYFENKKKEQAQEADKGDKEDLTAQEIKVPTDQEGKVVEKTNQYWGIEQLKIQKNVKKMVMSE